MGVWGKIARFLTSSTARSNTFKFEASSWGRGTRWTKARGSMILTLGAPVVAGFALSPPEERAGAIAAGVGVGMLTLGYRSAISGMFWGTAVASLPGIMSGVRSVGSMGRTYAELTSGFALPFSQSTQNMDMASASMQYASYRLDGARGALGFEAAAFAARYTNRNG